MAGEIHEEIGHQNKMLSELDEDLADAEEKLGMVMGKLAKLLKTKNKCKQEEAGVDRQERYKMDEYEERTLSVQFLLLVGCKM